MLCSTFVYSGVPTGINYQGRYEEGGTPVTGTRVFRFKIYDAETGGNLLWDSGDVSLSVVNGLFNYVLDCSNIDWKNTTPYLEVSVGGTVLSPREKIQSSPYAFYSSSASYADSAGLADDADKLGGQSPSYYLDTSAAAQTKSGDLSVNNLYVGSNVGIGTTGPSSKLEVVSSFSDSITMTINNNDISARGALFLHHFGTNGGATPSNSRIGAIAFRAKGTDGSTIFPSAYIDSYIRTNGTTNAPGDLRFYTNDGSDTSEKMRIDANGNVGIGMTSPGYKLDVNGQAHASSFPTSSDERFKTDIKTIDNALDIVMNLRGVRFKWNDFYKNTLGVDCNTDKYEFGVIAQETEKVVSEVVTKFKRQYKEKIKDDEEVEKEEEFLSVDYSRLVAVLIEAIKQQQKQIEGLKAKIETLETKLSQK